MKLASLVPIVRRIADNPAALFGLVTALLGVLVLFHVPLSKEQIGGIVVGLGAVVTFIQKYVISKRKVITAVTNSGRIVAGQAAALHAEGDTVVVTADPANGNAVPLVGVKPSLVK